MESSEFYHRSHHRLAATAERAPAECSRGFCRNGEPGEAGTRGINPIVQMRKVRARQGH